MGIVRARQLVGVGKRGPEGCAPRAHPVPAATDATAAHLLSLSADHFTQHCIIRLRLIRHRCEDHRLAGVNRYH